MLLKSLDIFGFKSFADKTKILFEPGITFIVGPNGCGKSNIIDAFRWGMGEKQARSIRGERMEDIIFAGTDNRKPLSVAEVSISVDNSNRILDIDSDTVTVTRRVFRDGESEYQINRSTVRLKDVDLLFMDTGIGKSSYSVMEQGKIDLILSSKAEDRRYFFEVAAGISRFKLQKKESLKKLEETDLNLKRVVDIINEIGREKDLKERQVEKLEKYLLLKSRLVDYDINLNIYKNNELTKKKSKLLVEIEALRKKREELSAKISRISAENERDEKLVNDIQLKLFELDKDLHTYRIKLEDIDHKTEKNRRLINEQNYVKDNIDKKIDERTKTIKRLNEEKIAAQQNEEEINYRLEDYNQKLNNLKSTRKSKIEFLTNSRDKIQQNKHTISLKNEDLNNIRNSMEQVIKELLDTIEKRKAEFTASEGRRQEIRNNINHRIDTISLLIKNSLNELNLGKIDNAVAQLSEIDIDLLQNEIQIFEDYEDGFRSILFDKSGVYAKKESLDVRIKEIVSSIDNLRAEIDELEDLIRIEQKDLDSINSDISNIEKNISRDQNDKIWIEKHLQSLNTQIVELDNQIKDYKDEKLRSFGIIKNFENEIREWEALLLDYDDKSRSLQKEVLKLTEQRGEIGKRMLQRSDLSKRDIENQKIIVDKISDKEKLLLEINFKISSIEEHLWLEYEKKLLDYKDITVDSIEYSNLQNNITETKRKIQDLGLINNLAIKEFEDLKNRFDYYTKQKEDIEKAKDDILDIIKDLDTSSAERFLETFNEIKKNMSTVFNQLFEGGDAILELADENNILSCGIEIKARPPGKSFKNIDLLSGGERALTAIALLFATNMVKPSPFYFLDEIDAPLDEENIGRFLKLLQKFSKTTQFIIISHSKKTMEIGQSFYGITMKEPGVSGIVSMKMDKVINNNPS